jgi:murein DD-endopeptidase MepM/ murein hydrolase activator NlpD
MRSNPFQLNSTLSRSSSADEDDTLNAKNALGSLGYYKTPKHGLAQYPDEPLFKGIKRFQSDNGLKRDGVMKPDGETARTLGTVMARRKQSTRPPITKRTNLLAPQSVTSNSIMPGEHDLPKKHERPIPLPGHRPPSNQDPLTHILAQVLNLPAINDEIISSNARTVKAALKTSDHRDLAKLHVSAIRDYGDNALAEVADFKGQLQAANNGLHDSWLKAFTDEAPDLAKKLKLASSTGNEDNPLPNVGEKSLLSEETIGVPPRKPEPPAPKPEEVDIPNSVSPIDNPMFRYDGKDTIGHPEFGASRDKKGKKYDHEGVDLRAAPGSDIKSPVSGKVVKIGHAYAGKEYRTVWVETADGHRVGMFYMTPFDADGNPIVSKGDTVEAGQVVGTMQDLTKMNPRMDNHLHLEIKKNDVVLDPAPWLEEWGVKHPEN